MIAASVESENEPLFWFPQYWMQEIYMDGIETVVRIRERNPPRRYTDESGSKREEGNSTYFYWMACEEEPLSSEFCLFGKSHMDGPYVPVVCIRKNDNDENGYRLYAARDFEFGEAITFLSELEEKLGSFILGGTYARIEYDGDKSNAFLTKNRTLRCTKRINKGDEIVRWIQGNDMTACLESVDQVVICEETMMVGKIGSELPNFHTGRVVHYSDRSMDMAKCRHLKVYRNFNLIPI